MKIELNQTYSFKQVGSRTIQEDSRFPNLDFPMLHQHVFCVCDGVGGTRGGEIASKVVCESVGKSVKGTDINSSFTIDDFRLLLDSAYEALDVLAIKNCPEMATTLAFVCFNADGCLIAHIGDTRIYHLRRSSGILYRSEDHTLVNAMVHDGIISPSSSKVKEQANIITRCMEHTESDQNRSSATVMMITDIKPDDYFFVCSDGVYNCIDENRLIDIILDQSNDDSSKISFISTLCENSSDNNTAFLIHVRNVIPLCDLNEEQEEYTSTTKRPILPPHGTIEIESDTNKRNHGIYNKIKKIFHL